MSNMKQDFDVEQFESRLENLKDTQDGIQQMSSWCLQQRGHHKKIVSSWLNVFKRVRVEHRLVLFYLANDVIQYSKRKRYEFVESWATALQRATTMVRDDKVRHKIFRILNIWQQRGIYSEEYLGDLSGLLSMNPSKKSQSNNTVEISSDEFQSSALISNVRHCVELSSQTDKSFKNLPKAPSCDIENIKAMLKDKSHSDDVEKELERYIANVETYKKHLAAEIKSRKAVLSNLETAITFYASQRGEVKVVVSAYKNFGSRIKLVKKKLDEITPNLPSPLSSPDINAPSPEPDTDINLPDEQNPAMNIFKSAFNGYSSYLDAKLPFDINDFKSSQSPKKSAPLSASQPIEVIASRSDSDSLNDSFSGPGFYKPEPINPMTSINPYSASSINLPLPNNHSEYSSLARPATSGYTPTPMPYGGLPPSNRYNSMVPNYTNEPNYVSNSSNNTYDASMPLMPPPMPPTLGGNGSGSQSDEFNSSWELDMPWNSVDTSSSFNHCLDTPISPAHFDREGSILDDSVTDYEESDNDIVPIQDVDHRQLHLPVQIVPPILPALGPNKPRQLDIDHRNLISLTGSPIMRNNDDKYKRANKTWIAPKDKDFRTLPAKPPVKPLPSSSGDVDYRTLPVPETKSVTIHPPLKPPPMLTGLLSFPQAADSESSSQEYQSESENRVSESKSEEQGYDPSDVVESIDMDMSDEDLEDIFREVATEGSTQCDQAKEPSKPDTQDTPDEQQHEPSKQQSDRGYEENRENASAPIKTVSYHDNLIPVANSRPPLLETPAVDNNSVWENQQLSQSNLYPPGYDEHQNTIDPGMHSNNNMNMRPPNPWKQPRLPSRIPGLPDQLPPVGGGFPHPADFHHQFQPRFPRSPFPPQPPRNFGPHMTQNHFRGSPRPMRGNPFFKPRGRGGGLGGTAPGGGRGGNMFRGKFRGNPWQ